MRRYLIALALFGVPASAGAIPVVTSISGVIANGQVLTVTGAGFGTKGVAAPLKWDTFEQGTNGAPLAGYPYVDAAKVTYSNLKTRPLSNMAAMVTFDDAVNNDAQNFGWDNFDFGGGGNSNNNRGKVFLDTWVFYQPATTPSRNYKLFRLHTNTYSPNSYWNLYCANHSTHFDQDGVGAAPSDTVDSWISKPANYDSNWWLNGGVGRWVHMQWYLEESGDNSVAANGKVIANFFGYDANGSLNAHTDGAINITHLRTRSATSSYWSQFYIGNWMGHDDAGSGCGNTTTPAYTYWDNVYVDTTLAHVEIGNAPTYALCSRREIQVPQSWSPGLIQIKVNQSGLASVLGSYLYVIDRNGAVNAAGYPVGVGGDITAPDPVIDLRAR